MNGETFRSLDATALHGEAELSKVSTPEARGFVRRPLGQWNTSADIPTYSPCPHCAKARYSAIVFYAIVNLGGMKAR